MRKLKSNGRDKIELSRYSSNIYVWHISIIISAAQSYIGQATIVGPRVVVNPKETGESLDKRLKKLTEELKASEKE